MLVLVELESVANVWDGSFIKLKLAGGDIISCTVKRQFIYIREGVKYLTAFVENFGEEIVQITAFGMGDLTVSVNSENIVRHYPGWGASLC